MSDQERTDAVEATEENESPETEAAQEETLPESSETGVEEDAFEFVDDPEFQVEYKGDCAYEVKVSIPASNEAKKSEELFGELQESAQVPGFRPGRAPRKLIEKRFAKAVRGDVTEKLVSAAFQKLIKDEDLNPIALPDVDGLEEVLDRPADAPLECTFSFEVSPRCELGEYKGLNIERPVLKIDESNVNEAIDTLRERYAIFEHLEEGGAEEGDQVTIDFAGEIDGEAFEGGSANDYPYILGTRRFFPEFEEVLKGAKAGDELTCSVTFPEDYFSNAVAGKQAEFTITVKELKRKNLPEINDEFAKQAGYEDAAQMREKVEAELREGAMDQSNQIAEAKAIELVVDASSFELPKSLVDSSANEYYQQEKRRLMALRVPVSDIEARDEEIRKQAQEDAERNIKAFVVVSEIGAAEKIDVTEEDFEKEAEQIQSRTGMDMAVVSRFLANSDKRDEYSNRIYREKAIRVIIDNATITDKEVTREELDKTDEESSES